MTKHDAQLVPIDSVKLYEENARIGDIPVIRESLRRNGQYRPLVVRKRTQQVLAGNHTWKAAKEEGWTEIWVTFVDCDAQTAKRINLVDNKSADLGGYDTERLVALLGALPDLGGTGFTGADYEKMASQLSVGQGADTEPGTLPETPHSQRGDLWLLGEHRLVCGDATDSGEVQLLMGADKVDCLYADPPYGTGGTNYMPGNARAGLQDLLEGAFSQAALHLRDGATIYASHPGDAYGVLFGNAFLAQGWALRQTLVWIKESAVNMGDGYHMQHELIAYGYAGPKAGAVSWHGDTQQSTVLKFARASSSNKHPTPRPIELVERLLTNSTKKGNVVYDLFSGSGSILIACENLRRSCRAIEIDPRYCDLIVDRWERHVGQEAQLIRGK